MRRIYNQYIIKYFPLQHIGPRPNVWARLTRDNAYRLYVSRVAEIRDHLSGIDDVQELITTLTMQYGLPIEKAREFVNKNVTREFRGADYRGKLDVLARANRALWRSGPK